MRPVPGPVYFALAPDIQAAAIGTLRTFLGHQSVSSVNPGLQGLVQHFHVEVLPSDSCNKSPCRRIHRPFKWLIWRHGLWIGDPKKLEIEGRYRTSANSREYRFPSFRAAI